MRNFYSKLNEEIVIIKKNGYGKSLKKVIISYIFEYQEIFSSYLFLALDKGKKGIASSVILLLTH